MNHYKEKTRSVQLTRTKTPPHKHHHKCKNQNKKAGAHHTKNRQKAHGPTNTATPSLRSSASAPLKKRPPDRKKKTIVRRPPISTVKKTPHAQNPLFQRLRAAPARAKPPVNFVLDREEKEKKRQDTSPHSKQCEKKDRQLSKRTKKKTKMRNQQQRKTYYAKQAVKPREPPIYNAEMLKKTKRNKQHSTAEKNIKTDINNEEKLAQKKTNQRQKETISTEMLNKQTAVKNNRTKRRNRRTQQTQSRRPPDNDKMTDKRSKPTKPRPKRAINGMKETYYRKTSRQATKQPEAHVNAQNRKKTISPAGNNAEKSPEPREPRRTERKKE